MLICIAYIVANLFVLLISITQLCWANYMFSFFHRIQTVNGQQKMARLRWRWIRQVSRHSVSLILWYNVRLALIVLKKAMHVTLIKISITLIKISTSFLFLIIKCLENIFCWQQKNILRQLHDLVKSCIFLMIERF